MLARIAALSLMAALLPASAAFAADDNLLGASDTDALRGVLSSSDAPTPSEDGEVVRTELPKVDADELRQALKGLDATTMASGFGVTGITAEGGVIDSEVSSELKALAHQVYGRIGTPAPMATDIDSVADPHRGGKTESTKERVFGRDDRVRIRNTRRYPFRAFGQLRTLKRDGKWWTCSATMIGRRTILTAAHCLYDHDRGGWGKTFKFYPGINGSKNVPYRPVYYKKAIILKGYISKYKGTYGSVVPWDLGVVILKRPVGRKLGWLGYSHDPNLSTFIANIVGYPGDKPSATMWHSSCKVPAKMIGAINMFYLCDTYSGSSGSSVYIYNAKKRNRLISGVNIANTNTHNIAVRLNSVYFKWVRKRTE